MSATQLPMFMSPHEILSTAFPVDGGAGWMDDLPPDEVWAEVLEEKRHDFDVGYFLDDEGYTDETPVTEPVHMWLRTRGQRSALVRNNPTSKYILTDGHHRLAYALDNDQELIPVVWVQTERESKSLWGDAKYVQAVGGSWYTRTWLDAALIFRGLKAP